MKDWIKFCYMASANTRLSFIYTSPEYYWEARIQYYMLLIGIKYFYDSDAKCIAKEISQFIIKK